MGNKTKKELIRDMLNITDWRIIKELSLLLIKVVVICVAVVYIGGRIPSSYRSSSPLLLIFLIPFARKIFFPPKLEEWWKSIRAILASETDYHIAFHSKDAKGKPKTSLTLIIIGIIGVIIFLQLFVFPHFFNK